MNKMSFEQAFAQLKVFWGSEVNRFGEVESGAAEEATGGDVRGQGDDLCRLFVHLRNICTGRARRFCYLSS